MKALINLLLNIFMMIFIVSFCYSKVSETKHNLSVTGPGPVKSIDETQICIFCHTPHNSSPEGPLWNHEVSAVTNYQHYWSPTLQAYDIDNAPPIDGFSKLCLSCHDGTVALGAIISCKRDEILMMMSPSVDAAGRLTPDAEGYIGTDLSGGHPVSFVFDSDLKIKRDSAGYSSLNWPINDRDVKLYPTQGGYGVQCTSCHDPHNNKAAGGWPPFWRKTEYDEVCEVCHSVIPEDIVIEW